MVGNGFEFQLPFDLAPAFPVVVVKDNERVTTSISANELTFQVPNSPFLYQFTDENFDNRKGRTDRNAAARTVFSTLMDQKLIDARNLMDPVDGWQRDHIYYRLTPTNAKGPFSLDFKECITSFRFNYGKEAYTKIAEQSGDPRVALYQSNSSTPPSPGAAWTEGSFEFLVNALVNAKTIGVPSTYKRFSANGYDLFDLEYELVFYKTCRWYQGCLYGDDLYVYAAKCIRSKKHHPQDLLPRT